MSKPEPRDWHGYDVYPDGRVFSNSGWRSKGYFEIKQSPDQYGYPAVRLMIGGKRKRERVHRLVAMLFHGPRPTPFHQVCHVDGDKLNNSSDNLYWGDARENAADRKRHGRTSSGAKHSSSIIAGQAASKLAAAAPELLEACQAFSRLHGRLWDVVEPSGSGFLSPESVKEYDAIHELMNAAIAKATA